MLPKEVKNGHIAEGKNPVEPKESDCKAFCDFDEFFHWLRLLCQDKVGAEDYIIFAHKRIYKFHGKDKVAGAYIRHAGVADITVRAAGKNFAVHGAVQDDAKDEMCVKCDDCHNDCRQSSDGDFNDSFHNFVLSRAD